LNHGEGAFFDSGTTLTHFPSATYNAMKTSLYNFCEKDTNNCGKGYGASSDGLCWNFNPKIFSSLEEYHKTFPTFKFYFGQDGDAEYQWKPEDYLYKKEGTGGKYCIGLARYDRETILGGTFMKNHDVLFDKNTKKLGFVRANCGAVNELSSPVYMEDTNNDPLESSNTESKTDKGPDTISNKKDGEQESKWSTLKNAFIMLAIAAIIGGAVYLYIRVVKKRKYNNMGNDIEMPESANTVKQVNPESDNTNNDSANQSPKESADENSINNSPTLGI